MKFINAITTIVLFSMIFVSCKQKPENNLQEDSNPIEETSEKSFNYSGNYVSDSYDQRAEGYDWVAVSTEEMAEDQMKVSVRSRTDKKSATCTFDAIAEKKDENTYQTTIDNKTVLFKFQDEMISISTEKIDDRMVLMFYCSGGGTVAGDYKKINDQLDQSQIDKTPFSNMVSNSNTE
ncbi:hypothetical protein [Nonlabens antarcticus]|uniref:hypothetical protein n=1 Tax=Nonlabens antarcticus TaxID=392714 RepID=UPI001891798D|nr:hypothetical protein [Nonlabens antarcticus]